jgi:hypothetical protein
MNYDDPTVVSLESKQRVVTGIHSKQWPFRQGATTLRKAASVLHDTCCGYAYRGVKARAGERWYEQRSSHFRSFDLRACYKIAARSGSDQPFEMSTIAFRLEKRIHESV